MPPCQVSLVGRSTLRRRSGNSPVGEQAWESRIDELTAIEQRQTESLSNSDAAAARRAQRIRWSDEIERKSGGE